MNTKQLIDEAILLPIEERALVADSLLKSLNQPDPDIDQAWIKEAKKRLAELRSGQVDMIAGDVVFEKIRQRFAK